MTSLISQKTNFKTRCENSAPIQAEKKEAKNSNMIPKMLAMRKEAKKRTETKRNEAKILFICFAN
jgi:hypothetical protein